MIKYGFQKITVSTAPLTVLFYTYKQQYADSHANALIEHSFKAGETIAVWLPESAEKHVTLIAAAQIGLTVVDFGSTVTTVEDLRQSL